MFKHLRNQHGFLRNVSYSLQKRRTLIKVGNFCQTFHNSEIVWLSSKHPIGVYSCELIPCPELEILDIFQGFPGNTQYIALIAKTAKVLKAPPITERILLFFKPHFFLKWENSRDM